jgi:hypothetical protein
MFYDVWVSYIPFFIKLIKSQVGFIKNMNHIEIICNKIKLL